ncbi:hypothetical protein SteCoe_3681 [Stentor coeruleus]|uniref:CHY-type domain-containing protein n=1 Tax=Stentor coeruleus TaxID=5963 RepID=A0A1R2CWD7_9CILI|nr:hypothetical protein SteCoe_3681 [Stentor coeruleus]
MVIKIVMEPPIIRTDYNNLIKRCIREFGHEKANHLGALITSFRDNHNETRNFKFRIFIGKIKYVSFLVKGGWGKLTRTKYLIDESKIQRYDRRNNFWYVTFRIFQYGLKIAGAITEFIPHGGSIAKPILEFAGRLSGYGAKAIGYDKGIYHNIKNVGGQCRHFIGNYIKLYSGCCNELYCCSPCHNEDKWHKWIYANYFICLICVEHKYQRYIGGDFTCPYCKYKHSIRPRNQYS